MFSDYNERKKKSTSQSKLMEKFRSSLDFGWNFSFEQPISNRLSLNSTNAEILAENSEIFTILDNFERNKWSSFDALTSVLNENKDTLDEIRTEIANIDQQINVLNSSSSSSSNSIVTWNPTSTEKINNKKEAMAQQPTASNLSAGGLGIDAEIEIIGNTSSSTASQAYSESQDISLALCAMSTRFKEIYISKFLVNTTCEIVNNYIVKKGILETENLKIIRIIKKIKTFQNYHSFHLKSKQMMRLLIKFY